MHRHAEKLWTHDAGLSALLGLLFLQIFVVFPFVDSTAGKMLVPIVFTLIVVSGVMTVIGTPHWGRM
ncbi:MAG: hypothetical protein FJY85_20600, partial [Deltaproteobacteria bacterium]|nr:hypothetical protein [Deltaproteobacteria bacterium]